MRAAVKIVCVGAVAMCICTAATAADGGKAKRPPAELWQAFPLEPKPAQKPGGPAEVAPQRTPTPPKPQVKPPERAAPTPPAASREDPRFPLWLLATLIGATAIAVAIGVVIRHAHASLFGGLPSVPARSPTRASPRARLRAYSRVVPEGVPDLQLGEASPAPDVASLSHAAEVMEWRLREAARSSGAPRQLPEVPPAPQPEPEPEPEPEPKPRPKLAEARPIERCSIGVWRGGVEYRFFAALLDPELNEERIAYSPAFDVAAGAARERTLMAQLAHAQLLTHLEDLGWSVVSEGPQWYERLLERRRPPEEDDTP